MLFAKYFARNVDSLPVNQTGLDLVPVCLLASSSLSCGGLWECPTQRGRGDELQRVAALQIPDPGGENLRVLVKMGPSLTALGPSPDRLESL
jgi:hypothetical protein